MQRLDSPNKKNISVGSVIYMENNRLSYWQHRAAFEFLNRLMHIGNEHGRVRIMSLDYSFWKMIPTAGLISFI